MKPRNPSLPGSRVVISLGLALGSGSILLAAPVGWDGDTDPDFANGLNWTGGTAPADDLVTDVATFGGTPTSNQPELSSGDRGVHGLDFQSGGWTLGGSSTLTLGSAGISSTGTNVVSVFLNTGAGTTLTAEGGYISLSNTTAGAVSGTGQLTIAGSGTVFIDGAGNSYTGGTLVTGTAAIKNIDSLGTGAVTLDGGTLASNGSSVDTNGRAITLTTNGGTLTANGARIGVGGASSISGAGQLTIGAGNNTVFLDNANTHTGGTVVKGLVSIKNAAALGSGAVTFDGGTLTNNGVTLTVANAVSLATGTGTLKTTGANNLTLSGLITGDKQLTIEPGSGTGRVILNNAGNTYSGGTVVKGLLQLTSSTNLAYLGTGGITLDGGTLVTANNTAYGTKGVVLTSNGGTLTTSGGRHSFNATAISGTGSLTVDNGNNDVFFDVANTFSGNLVIKGTGRVGFKVNGSLGDGGAGNNIVLEDGGRLFTNAATNGTTLTTGTRSVTLNGTGGILHANKGDLNVAGVVGGTGSLTVQGGAQTVILAGNNTYTGGTALPDANSKLRVTGNLGGGSYAGVISGAGSFEYAGSGTQTLSGDSTYTGATTVTSGTLVVNGNISTSSLTSVKPGATIGGGGTVGALTIESGAFHNPGTSPGIMNTGDYTLAGLLTMEITGGTPGAGGYDQLNITGGVNLAGGSLSTLFSGGSFSNGDLLFLLLNDGTDAVSGTFSGLAQGDTVASFGGFDWRISYTADSGSDSFLGGNDIALMAVPEPAAALLGGMGVLALMRRRRS